MTMAATCNSCRFWEADYFIEEAPSTMGRCHRRAPSPNGTQIPDADAVWPSTRGDDWCGEHELSATAPSIALDQRGTA
jgi:hypothetical protein